MSVSSWETARYVLGFPRDDVFIWDDSARIYDGETPELASLGHFCLVAISKKLLYNVLMVKNASPILKALEAATHSELAAVEFLEQHRWNGTPGCVKCGSVNVYRMLASDGTRNKDYPAIAAATAR